MSDHQDRQNQPHADSDQPGEDWTFRLCSGNILGDSHFVHPLVQDILDKQGSCMQDLVQKSRTLTPDQENQMTQLSHLSQALETIAMDVEGSTGKMKDMGISAEMSLLLGAGDGEKSHAEMVLQEARNEVAQFVQVSLKRVQQQYDDVVMELSK